MNKELYIKWEKNSKKIQELSSLLNCLQTFLKENEKNFKKEESIEALKKIKTYLKTKEEEYQTSVTIQEKKELYSTCNHEVAIKRNNMSYYQCLICKHNLTRDINDNLEHTHIFIDTTQDYQAIDIIEEIFEEIVHNDKDLIETINNELLEMQYDKDIKVYRRTK